MGERSRSRSAPRGALEVTWFQYTSPEGHPYYHQKETGQTVWERPSGPNDRVVDPNAPAVPAAAALPGLDASAVPGLASLGQLPLQQSVPQLTQPLGDPLQVLQQPAAQTSLSLEITWMRCVAPTGQEYYHNPTTSQTVWEKPSGPMDRIVDHPALIAQQQQLQLQQMQQLQLQQLLGAGIPGLGAAGVPGLLGAATPAGTTDVDGFIARNNIDANAGQKLKSLPPDLMRQVVERGDLQEARNPNAVLMSRIREAERSGMSAANPLVATANVNGDPATEAFIVANKIDPSAGDKLRAAPAEVRKKVLDRGNLTDARNPNAMLMGRLRDAEREVAAAA
eukprot:TRINITY_DN31483_c0_g1_i1.p1 TRINITY_DN31483_c0_g1~~TRINITY_DN31483_c0_g1_i1.p1  ORF type:complete len:337 (-),score=62.43 TRINITY_DN31483_c0_g1_i1:103-1113(-)